MLKLTVLGSGTSQGVPVVSCGCWVCTSPDPRDKRLRASVMVESDDTTIIIDAGPDFRAQMLREGVNEIDGILLTHAHKDHVGGLDDVRAFNYTSRKPVNIYASEDAQKTVVKDFDYAFTEHPYPGVPQMNLITIDHRTPFTVGNMKIIPVLGQHYRIPVLGFRIGNIAYLTDFNAIEQQEIDKIMGVDVLIINALRREHHVSHFTLDEALELSHKAQAKRTYFTHVSHQMGRHAQIDKELPENKFFAFDGLIIEA